MSRRISDAVSAGPIITTDEISTPVASGTSAAKVVYGRVIPPQQQIILFSFNDWEVFLEEWAHYQKSKYQKVVRVGGANDMGVDVAGFTDENAFSGVWDNFQAKHYGDPLTPSTAIPEIAKCLWHSYVGHFTAPRKYFFMAPKGCGPKLKRLLLDPTALKDFIFDKWDEWCANKITSTRTINLEGAFKKYVERFPFKIFTFKTALDLIDEHRKTPYFSVRFGGGLADRPSAEKPPSVPASKESRYLQQLFEAYSDHKKQTVLTLSTLAKWPPVEEHYHRQRELFYHAESLRSFARDSVPPGTFEELQDEIYAGVVDVSFEQHVDAYVRLNAVTKAASQLALTSNGLISVVKIQDRRGICHQLANDNKLVWKQ